DLMRRVLEGEQGAARDMSLLNAAGALVVADAARDFSEGLSLAREAVDGGLAARTLGRLIDLTNQ
ncbi:MAG: anthranilate phosphoribosyltransferase, partial [Planctomycetota bacterium]|nr:anthranilate phosphoribosyltransferase [Planctomycetota bacterium]